MHFTLTRRRSYRLRILWIALAVFSVHSKSQAQLLNVHKTIAVRIMVDEEEPRVQALWQQTLAERLHKASAILSDYGSIRFSVTKFSTWDSDDTLTDFAASLREFEQKARPDPAELCIGFSSQYTLRRGRSNLGGTRGPMRRHILLREAAPKIEEIERLEVLVHELSHFLGAAHSGNANSVMRPVLGDGKSRARAFRIKLDEPNAQIVRLISGEMASRNVKSMHALSVATKTAIRDNYLVLAKSFPQDDVAKNYAALMNRSIQASLTKRQQRKQQRSPTLPLAPQNNSKNPASAGLN